MIEYTTVFCCVAGPEHPWLASIYGKHAPHPFGSVVGEEIFQSGIIPGDTDFRIYRDYGGLPGKLTNLLCFYKLCRYIQSDLKETANILK